MTPDEVAETLDDVANSSQRFLNTKPLTQNHYSRTRGVYRSFGLTLYYGLEKRLCSVVVDALCGPQVRAEGIAFTGCVPSELEQWMVDRAEAYEPHPELNYFSGGVPGSESLGLVIGVQRAGDHLLTQPVFLSREVWDGPTEGLPEEVSVIH
ncbi:hypothetical protein [Nocardia sp.]|uniref:hypothetical protein n=1 Tax=Nocardia sp. TaxID=1821 RepID=UPI002627F6E5|nr:hypothetical protein [Nocardia sp.]